MVFDESASPEERMIGVKASTASPLFFPPVDLQGMSLVDGGVYATVSLGDVIHRCQEDGFDDADIVIDILLCYQDDYDIAERTTAEISWMTAFDFYKRRKEINRFYY